MAEDGRVSIFVGRRGARTSDPEEWLALIRDERLRRTDTVAVRRDGETAWTPAGDVPELRPLFDQAEAEGPVPNLPPSRPAPHSASQQQASDPSDGYVLPADFAGIDPDAYKDADTAVPVTPAGFGSEPETAKPAKPPRRPTAPPQPRRGGGCATAFWITLLLLGGAVFLGLRACGGDSGERRSAETAAAIASAEPVDRFVTRTSRVRSAPSAASAPPVGQLRRGEAVTGVLTADPNDVNIVWMRLTAGRWPDRYVWAANLDTQPPPRLLGGAGGMRTVASRGDMRLRPDSGAERLARLSPGDRLRVAGSVGGGWLEVLRPSGGVAYVREEALRPDAGAPGPLETEAAAPGEALPD